MKTQPKVGAFIVGYCVLSGREKYGYVISSKASMCPIPPNTHEWYTVLRSDNRFIEIQAWFTSYKRIPSYAIAGFLEQRAKRERLFGAYYATHL